MTKNLKVLASASDADVVLDPLDLDPPRPCFWRPVARCPWGGACQLGEPRDEGRRQSGLFDGPSTEQAGFDAAGLGRDEDLTKAPTPTSLESGGLVIG